MWGSDYVQLSSTPPSAEQKSSAVSWEELRAMDLPSFEPAFLVLCRVLLDVIHECLKLRLEQRPAGEPSLLSIKQVCGRACHRRLGVRPGDSALTVANRTPAFSFHGSFECSFVLEGKNVVQPLLSASLF